MKPLACCAIAVIMLSAAPAWAQTSDVAAQDEPKQNEPRQEEPKKDAAPPPPHGSTGWKSLVKDSAGDFVAFPKRPSTWVLISAGAVAALATHPADHYVQTHIVVNDTADKFFSLGQWVGS